MPESHLFATPTELKSRITIHFAEARKLGLIPLIAVVGPTASGKTALAIALAQTFAGEIVSADSRQIYTEMDIGTAKATHKEQQEVPHHLIDIVSPERTFSLSDYQKLAQQTILEIHQRSKIPFLVGGTGLYISSITQNYSLPDSQPDLLLRQQLENLATQAGKQAVHQILEQLDPSSAVAIHPNNLRYVIRAIEIVKQTSQPKSSQTAPIPYHTLYLSIDWPRIELYQKINQRIDAQIAAGLIAETQQLLSKYPHHPPALTSLGYQEIGAYLGGQISLELALEEFKQNTRNYAKRQLTWFRKIKSVYSIPGNQLAEFILALPRNP